MKVQGAQIQTTEISYLKVLKHTSILHHLHQNAHSGIPVPEYMFVLFDEVHQLCPNTSFLFAGLVHKSKFMRRVLDLLTS
jgi:hypothetical protein